MSLLEIDGVNSFYGSSHVLFDIGLNVQDGECVALLGRNGAGKTTLFKTIAGAIRAGSGQICFDGQQVQSYKPERIARMGIQLVPEGRNIFGGLTVEENLYLSALTAANAWEIEEVYKIFPRLKERAKYRGKALSGGEQQMLAIARALIRRPRLILLDEPFEGLAPSIVDHLINVCSMLVEQRQTIVIVEQNVNLALELSSRCYVLNNGHVVFKGSSSELEHAPDIVSAYLGVY